MDKRKAGMVAAVAAAALAAGIPPASATTDPPADAPEGGGHVQLVGGRDATQPGRR